MERIGAGGGTGAVVGPARIIQREYQKRYARPSYCVRSMNAASAAGIPHRRAAVPANREGARVPEILDQLSARSTNLDQAIL
jgi:hypothetical protein